MNTVTFACTSREKQSATRANTTMNTTFASSVTNTARTGRPLAFAGRQYAAASTTDSPIKFGFLANGTRGDAPPPAHMSIDDALRGGYFTFDKNGNIEDSFPAPKFGRKVNLLA